MIETTEEHERASRSRMNGHHPDPTADRPRKRDDSAADPVSSATEDAITERILARLGGVAGGVLYDAAGAVAAQPLALLSGQPAPPPQGAVLHPPAATEGGPRAWLLVRLWVEVRIATRMYFDPRYRISRTAQFLLPAILGLFLANYFFFTVWFAVPILSPVLERFVCIILGVCAFRVIAHEVARYRGVLEYLTKYVPR